MPDSIIYQQPIPAEEVKVTEPPVINTEQTLDTLPAVTATQQGGDSTATLNTNSIDTDTIIRDNVFFTPVYPITPAAPRSFIMGDSTCNIPESESFLLDQKQQSTINPQNDSAQIYRAAPYEVYGHQSVLKAQYTGTQMQVGEGISTFSPINSSWFDVIAIALLICILLVITSTRSFLNSLTGNILSYQKTHKNFKVNSQTSSLSRQLYFVPLVFILSLFFLYIGNYLGITPNDNPLYTYAGIIILLMAFMLIKYFLLLMVGFVTKTSVFIDELFYNRQISIIITGLLIFPWVLLSSIYLDPTAQKTFLGIGFFIFTVYILFFTIRTYFIFKEAHVSHFLWFLYLCILEIAPYLTLSIIFQQFANEN